MVKSRNVAKFYASRSTRLHGSAGPQTRIYLHKAILERAGQVPPSDKHIIGDHKDGNSLNNRRENLRWATVVENNRNRFGSYAKQRRIELSDAPQDIPF